MSKDLIAELEEASKFDAVDGKLVARAAATLKSYTETLSKISHLVDPVREAGKPKATDIEDSVFWIIVECFYGKPYCSRSLPVHWDLKSPEFAGLFQPTPPDIKPADFVPDNFISIACKRCGAGQGSIDEMLAHKCPPPKPRHWNQDNHDLYGVTESREDIQWYLRNRYWLANYSPGELGIFYPNDCGGGLCKYIVGPLADEYGLIYDRWNFSASLEREAEELEKVDASDPKVAELRALSKTVRDNLIKGGNPYDLPDLVAQTR